MWCELNYDEAPHYLKLRYREGEIDFIVAMPTTDIPALRKRVGAYPGHEVSLEHPVETALKKLRYRGQEMKVRDAFDVAVVEHTYPDLLREALRHVSRNRAGIKARLGRMKPDFFAAELAELDLQRRGAGEFFGVRQHGWDSLQVASWFDLALLQKVKDVREKVKNSL